ncbi:MAG: ammonium transporter [Microbacteriaceae bacterium]|nr:ammonium transporter [Microbacteriaceae bacterium]
MSVFAAAATHAPSDTSTLWLLVAAAMVLLMTPGLAFFYGGMVQAKSVINMMMMSFGAIALVSVLWILYGYSMSFGVSGADGRITDWAVPHLLLNPFANIGLHDYLPLHADGTMSALNQGDAYSLAFVGFEATFAIITVALISGAIADRAKFGSWMIFAGVWVTVVYFPVASWVFSSGGWLKELGLHDFAGGTVIEINSGAAALALALVLGRRIGFTKGMVKPHNVPLTLIGAALLWFGWFGFNGGSAGAVNTTAALAWINTLAAPAAATVGWLATEKLKDGKPTSIGAASGAVTGLVAITPSANVLTPMWALVLGLIAGVLSCLAVELKWRLGFDDTLDVVGIHLVGGLTGTLFIGLVGAGIGLIDIGSLAQLGAQAVGCLAVGLYSFGVAYGIGWLLQKTIGFRITSQDESAGVDTIVHGEESYAI